MHTEYAGSVPILVQVPEWFFVTNVTIIDVANTSIDVQIQSAPVDEGPWLDISWRLETLKAPNSLTSCLQ